MDIYRVSLIGHREIENCQEIEKDLMTIFTELLQTKEFVEFQLGRNGAFDILAASCVKWIQNRYDNHNSAMTLILPYPVANMQSFKNYNEFFLKLWILIFVGNIDKLPDCVI